MDRGIALSQAFDNFNFVTCTTTGSRSPPVPPVSGASGATFLSNDHSSDHLIVRDQTYLTRPTYVSATCHPFSLLLSNSQLRVLHAHGLFVIRLEYGSPSLVPLCHLKSPRLAGVLHTIQLLRQKMPTNAANPTPPRRGRCFRPRPVVTFTATTQPGHDIANLHVHDNKPSRSSTCERTLHSMRLQTPRCKLRPPEYV